MPTPSFKKRKSSRLSLDTYMILGLAAAPFVAIATLIPLYVYGVVSAFKASVVFGLVFLFPPFGLVEGIAKLFRYDVALALKALALANGVTL